MSLGVWLFILTIALVILIHEAGHFSVAKLFGFKATKFFLGFGPTLWSFHKGETEYGLKAIPAGGFVKIVGMNPYEEVPPEDEPRAYPNKPAPQRALLLVAGSATHFLLALVTLTITAMTLGFPTGEVTNEVAAVTRTMDGSTLPAAQAGIRPGDRIVAIDQRPVDSWQEVSSFIRQHPGDAVTFTVERDGRRLRITARLGKAVFSQSGRVVAFAPAGGDLPQPRAGQSVGGFFGVSPEPQFETEGFFGAIATGARLTGDYTVRSVTSIDDVFRPVFNGDLWTALQGDGPREAEKAPVGVVGAGRIAGSAVEKGLYVDFIVFMVFFTIFIGVMNLLPLPPLDGGHLAVIAYESVTGRTVDIRRLIPVAAAVISFFVLIFLAVLYLDLVRPLSVSL